MDQGQERQDTKKNERKEHEEPKSVYYLYIVPKEGEVRKKLYICIKDQDEDNEERNENEMKRDALHPLYIYKVFSILLEDKQTSSNGSRIAYIHIFSILRYTYIIASSSLEQDT